MKFGRALLSVGLCFNLALGLIGCGGKNASEPDKTQATESSDSVNKVMGPSENQRTIHIGTWYPHYYDSTHQDIHDDPNLADEAIATARLEALRAVEEKYNVRIEFVDLTWNGVQDSISDSVVIGRPECDIYEVDMTFGIPDALSGYAVDLESVLDADADVLSSQIVFKPTNIGLDHGVYLFTTNSGESLFYNTNVLAYDKDMFANAGLEDPISLWRRGEWTWEIWKDYMKALTVDRNGDGIPDVYGFSSRWDYLISGLLLSNGTAIAPGAKEGMSAPATREVFQLIYDMYNVDRCAKPWNSEDYNDNVNAYQKGKVAMWLSSAPMSADNNDVETFGAREGWVPFPEGPSGNHATNYTKNSSTGNAWLIPMGVENPAFVYQVFEEYMNWYKGDITLRDGDMSWWEKNALSKDNYEVMKYCGSRGGFDLWNALNIDYQMPALLGGEITVDDFIRQNTKMVQTALDTMFAN